MENFDIIEYETLKYINDFVGLDFLESKLNELKNKKVNLEIIFGIN